jgi:predicted nucleic acid-binding protein
MIVVDTSVWIAALRSASSHEAEVLTALLDADEVGLPLPVRLELVAGAGRKDRARLRRALSALPVLYPADETWGVIDRWIERAADAGESFGVGDLLIAALAHQQSALVWSLDRDFARMKELHLIELYEGDR